VGPRPRAWRCKRLRCRSSSQVLPLWPVFLQRPGPRWCCRVFSATGSVQWHDLGREIGFLSPIIRAIAVASRWKGVGSSNSSRAPITCLALCSACGLRESGSLLPFLSLPLRQACCLINASPRSAGFHASPNARPVNVVPTGGQVTWEWSPRHLRPRPAVPPLHPPCR